jgi:poly(hydroxyalkanoate) granule-associated protein
MIMTVATTKRAATRQNNGGATMAEEVEIKINEVEDAGANAGNTFFEGIRRLLLASIGAVAMTRDETEAFVNKLVERGELAQKDAEKLLREVRARVRESRPQVQKVGERVGQGMEDFLNRMNIPSKRDIDDLSARIAQLAARVEELRKQKQ